MRFQDPVTITIKFERPATDEALAGAINAMVCALPAGKDGNVRVQISLDGIPAKLAAALETGFAIGKAQIAARASRRAKRDPGPQR